jgi:4-carboxymuconolactone decarboxylase
VADDDRVAAGLRRYREVYGDDAVVFPRGEAAFFDLMMEHLFDGVWNRPGLEIEQRRLLTMGVLAAQHRFDVLQLQFERALVAGELTTAQVREVVIQLIPYVGYPSSGAIFGAGEQAIAATSAAATDSESDA